MLVFCIFHFGFRLFAQNGRVSVGSSSDLNTRFELFDRSELNILNIICCEKSMLLKENSTGYVLCCTSTVVKKQN